jgi:hypothetical protein
MNGDDSKSSFFKGVFMNLVGSVEPNVGTRIEPRHTTINETRETDKSSFTVQEP